MRIIFSLSLVLFKDFIGYIMVKQILLIILFLTYYSSLWAHDETLPFIKPKPGNATYLHIAVNSTDCHTLTDRLTKKRRQYQYLEARDEQGKTALLLAIEYEKLRMIDELLEAGADPNAISPGGLRPLHLISSFKKTNIALFLIKKGALVNEHAHTRFKNTPLHYAVSDQNISLVKILIKYGADVDLKNYRGWTALHWAALRDNASLIKLLYEAKANVDVQDKNGYTPLHLAALHASKNAVRVLLELGANANAVNQKGHNPYALARMANNDAAQQIEHKCSFFQIQPTDRREVYVR